MKRYIKDNKFYQGSIVLEDKRIINPTHEQILTAGYTEYIEGIDEVRDAKIREIKVYDQSSAVNNFILYGENCWLDKQTRVGITNLIDYQLAAGLSVTNLWLNGREYIFTIAQAREMLGALELYAIGCYNVTQRHIAALQELNSIEEIKQYNYTNNYPDKLNFN